MVKFVLNSNETLRESRDKLWRDAQNGFLTDISITIGGQMLKAHRVVLASQSEFLRSFFASSKQKVQFNLSAIGYHAVEATVKLIYCQEVHVQPEEVENVASLIKLLKMDAGLIQEPGDGSSDDNGDRSSIPEPLRHPAEASFADVFNSTVIDETPSPTPSASYGSLASEGLSDDEPVVVRRHKAAASKRSRFRRKSYLLRPKRSSIGLLSESCRYCPCQRFASSQSRANHELTCPFNRNSREFFKCDQCGKSYLLQKRLMRHVRENHTEAQ